MLPIVTSSVAQEVDAGITLGNGNAWIQVPSSEKSQVVLAVQALQKDFKKVLNFTPTIVRTSTTREGVRIVVVNDENPDGLALIDNPRELDGFESHRVYVDAASNSIVLHGKDMRGTIYAIYSFSEKVLGVPPLWYWCSWEPEVKESIELPSDYDYFCPSPQVRYRAWFPNDQDLFVPWRRKSTDNNERWLETMLRLKLNTVEYTATVTNSGTLNSEALLYKKYGLVLTSHHMVALNNSFSNWDSYWKNVRGQSTVPTLSVKDTVRLKEFWQYSINCVMNSDVENLWQVAFRGKTDQPFWEIFSDAPSGDKERADIINQMVAIQYRMIKEATGEADPFVRMTFYDEISSLLAKGYLKPPTARNMLWTFVAGRRDHYPFDDLVQWQNTDSVQLGYYMNLQFYSTGAHLAPAEGPWKMEDNYRYVQSKGKQTFSVVNAGNVREFLMEMAANAAMMWNADTYNTNDFLVSYCKQYFGEEHAQAIADLYHDFYYSYWCQKKSDFPGGFDRQYIFQDLRHERAIKQINDKWSSYTANPLSDIGYESIPGRSFRIEGSNQVDSIIAGTAREMVAFANVAERCDAMASQIPASQRTFFYDNLSAYAHYMSHVSACLHYFALAYKNKTNRYDNLTLSLAEMKAAKKSLTDSQHDIFSTWYASDDKFAMDAKIEMIQKRLDETPPFTIEAGKAYTIAPRNDNNLFVQDNGSDILSIGSMSDNACWEFISTGKPNCFYIKNLSTGRYAQACAAATEVSISMGTTPVEYVVVDCSDQEGSHCFGFTSTNLSVTDFTAGCIGWNWRDDNTVQTYAAVSGTNHRSFWKLSETTYTKPDTGEKDLTELISNNDFEETTGMVVDGTNFRGIPTGWHGWGIKGNTEYTQEPGVTATTLLPKTSYGANGGCSGTRHGEKSCWVNCSPMPDDFKLYQSISLPAGTYRVNCLLSPMGTGDENLTNLRLFAGDNACYFATADKYGSNLGPETNRTFMGYTATMDGSDPVMKEMTLEFSLPEAAEIQIGIRTSNMLKSGSRATSNQGRFRVDYFRLYSIAEMHVHDYTHNGICTCDGTDRFETPTKSGSYYLLDNAGKVEWFSNMVAATGGTTSYYARLTADIDFEREVNLHLPIGKTKGNKFKGIFDGQGHRIKNMVIYRPQDEALGFFGYLQGNSSCTVKNLIIDESCSVIAYTKAAGLAGSCQNTGATITIENCVNEASVTVTGQDAAGIIGGQNDTNPKFVIRNCVNTGSITSTNANPYAGGLCCYLGNSDNTIENVINLGTITGHEGGNIGRMSGSVKAVIDLSDTEQKTQGIVDGLSSADIASGGLTYYINNAAGKEVFFQTLGEDAYPLPFSTSKSVKQISIPASGYAAYVAEADVQFPSEVEAFAVVFIDKECVRISEAIAEAAAGEAVIVKGVEGRYCYNPVDSASSPAFNLLQVAAKKVVNDGTQYCLVDGEQGIGFYRVAIGSTIPAGQVYLTIASEEAKDFYAIEPDDETSIDEVESGKWKVESSIFNLAGVRATKTAKGPYIVKGKKFLKK